VHAFCTPGDTGLLPAVLDAAEAHHLLSAGERQEAAAEMADERVIFPLPR
jgi:hypothetical protein